MAVLTHWSKRIRRGRVAGQIVRYFLMTGLSAMITLLLPVALHAGVGLSVETAVAVSLVAAFFVNFLTIRAFVFRSATPAGQQLVRFTLTSAGFRVGEYLFFLILYNILEIYYFTALIVTLVVSLPLKFLCYRRFVFQPLPDPYSSASRSDYSAKSSG